MFIFDRPPNFNALSEEGENIENIENQSVGEKILDELNLYPDVNSDNFESIAEQVKNKLSLKSEKDLDLLDLGISVKENMSMNLRKAAMGEGRKNKRILREFAIKDSIWMNNVCSYIKNIENDKKLSNNEKSSEIEKMWNDISKYYDNEDYFNKIKDINQKYDYSFRLNKYGILGQLAAEKLVLEIKKHSEILGIDDIQIEHSTPEEDVDDKIDFYILVTRTGVTTKHPCQVKSKKYTNIVNHFIRENIVTSVNNNDESRFVKTKGKRISSPFEKKSKVKIEQFRKKHYLMAKKDYI